MDHQIQDRGGNSRLQWKQKISTACKCLLALFTFWDKQQQYWDEKPFHCGLRLYQIAFFFYIHVRLNAKVSRPAGAGRRKSLHKGTFWHMTSLQKVYLVKSAMLFMQKRNGILFAIRIRLVCEFSSKEDHSVIYESIYLCT